MRRTPRGQPLLALILVLGCWVGFRIMFRDLIAFAPVSTAMRVSVNPAEALPARPMIEALRARREARADTVGSRPALEAATARRSSPLMPLISVAPPPMAAPYGPERYAVPPYYTRSGASSPPYSVQALVRTAAARQVEWMTMPRSSPPYALAPPPYALAPRSAGGQTAATVTVEPPGRSRSRWSGDGWLLLRRGGDVSSASGPAPATYGASQAGAVLRYRLAPDDRHRPSAYVRGTIALNGSAEREAAAGLSARLVGRLPVTVAAEVRATVQAGGTRLRPALTAYTELPPIELPRRLRGEAYVQAGYVGGSYATPFVDGQLRIDRKLEAIGRGEVRAGVGAWGGAQKGASRLDLGPAAMVGVGLGGVGLGESASARLALDWRFRVAGNADPSSGPALTLSAGF